MSKSELIATIAEKTGYVKKDIETIVNITIDTIQEQLVAGDSVQIAGFGSLNVSRRNAREGHNPKTGEKIKIPASNTVSFKIGKNLKEAVNK